MGNAGCPVHPQPRVRNGSFRMHTSIHSGRTGNHPASPHAMVLTASFVLSPAIGFFATVACSVLTANLTPASRRQDHTTSPSASALFVKSAAASTASRPASVTMANAPLAGRDGADIELICGFGKPEYFLRRDWTGRNSLIRLTKLDFTRKFAGARGEVGQTRPTGRRATRECADPRPKSTTKQASDRLPARPPARPQGAPSNG